MVWYAIAFNVVAEVEIEKINASTMTQGGERPVKLIGDQNVVQSKIEPDDDVIRSEMKKFGRVIRAPPISRRPLERVLSSPYLNANIAKRLEHESQLRARLHADAFPTTSIILQGWVCANHLGVLCSFRTDTKCNPGTHHYNLREKEKE